MPTNPKDIIKVNYSLGVLDLHRFYKWPENSSLQKAPELCIKDVKETDPRATNVRAEICLLWEIE